VQDFQATRSAAPGRAARPADDRQLVRAAALGDLGAWDLIVERYAARVWGLAVHGTSRDDQAVAVCELVWRRLAQTVPHLGGEPLAAWLDLVTGVECHHARLRTRSERPHDRRRHPRASSG
jgi:hypothetical protein